MHTQRSRPTLVAGLLAALAAAGCARNAATGATQFSLIGEAQEIQMGRENDQQIAASVGLYPDSALQAYVQQLGTRLAATSERPGLPWTFRVVDDAAVNAFALPGGFIYVTRGLLAHVGSEAQLASVIGHEIGHVTARHSVTQLSRQQLAGFGLALGSALSSTIARYGALASTGLSILFLAYTRADEQQADELGLRYMVRGGWDPHEMPEVFTSLDRLEQSAGGARLPGWLATHPSPASRRSHITQGIAALPPGFGTTVNRDPYLRRLDNLVFGADPREGYFRGALFLHPASRFRLTFPEGWTTANEKQAVSAVSPQQDAVVQLTLAQEPSAAAAASSFFSQLGNAAPAPTRGLVGGLPAVSGPFTAVTENGTLSGDVVFVEHGGGVLRLLAYASEARWSAYREAADRALQSFAPLTDPAILNAQPLRVRLVTLSRATTLDAFSRGRQAGAPLATLALINQVEPQTPLAAGRVVKWVTGQPAP
jgi:predicted Zn-dependent protease